MTGLVAATMAIVYLLPRLTRAVPPALVAILGVGLAVYLLRSANPHPGRHGPHRRWPADLRAAAGPLDPGNPRHHRALRCS